MLRRACNAGDPRAKYELGLMLMQSPAISHRKQGHCLIIDAAQAGHMQSQCQGQINDIIYAGSVAELNAFNCVYPMMSQRAKVMDRGGGKRLRFCHNPFCLRVVSVEGQRDLRRKHTFRERRFLRRCGISAERETVFRPKLKSLYCGESCQRLHQREQAHTQANQVRSEGTAASPRHAPGPPRRRLFRRPCHEHTQLRQGALHHPERTPSHHVIQDPRFRNELSESPDHHGG